MRDDLTHLAHIALCMDLVAEYLRREDGTLDHDLFLSDGRTQDAVMRRLEILADSAGQLSPELKARHPAVPWRRITGFRNALAHGYLSIDLEIVWQTISESLPALRTIVDAEGRADQRPPASTN